MNVRIIKRDSTFIALEWCDEDGFGQLYITYNNKGGYEVDAEYMGIEKVLEILKHVDLKQ